MDIVLRYRGRDVTGADVASIRKLIASNRVLPARVRGTVDGACYRGGVGRRIASAYTPGARGADEARA